MYLPCACHVRKPCKAQTEEGMYAGVIVLDDSPVAQQPAAVATGAPMATVAREDPDGEHVCTKPHSTPQLPSSPRSPDNIHQGRRSSDEGAAGDQTDAGTPGFLGADGDDSPDFFGALMGSYDGFAQRPARPPLHSQDGSEDAPASTGGLTTCRMFPE